MDNNETAFCHNNGVLPSAFYRGGVLVWGRNVLGDVLAPVRRRLLRLRLLLLLTQEGL